MEIINIVDKLPKGREAYKRRETNEIKKIILHHSATTTGTPEGFAKYHVETNGWGGIGYHFVIQKDGTIYQTNNDTTLSYHCKGYNQISLGICLVGDFDKQQPTEAQHTSLKELLVYLLKKYGLSTSDIIGHRETPAAHKTCPGICVNLNQIRAEAVG